MSNKQRANYSLSAEVVEALRKVSEETGLKQSTIVERAVTEYLGKLERGES